MHCHVRLNLKLEAIDRCGTNDEEWLARESTIDEEDEDSQYDTRLMRKIILTAIRLSQELLDRIPGILGSI